MNISKKTMKEFDLVNEIAVEGAPDNKICMYDVWTYDLHGKTVKTIVMGIGPEDIAHKKKCDKEISCCSIKEFLSDNKLIERDGNKVEIWIYQITKEHFGMMAECRYDDYTDWTECKVIGFDGPALVVAVDDGYVIAEECRIREVN